MPQIFHKILFALSLLAAATAQAQLSIEITGAGANRIPVAIANFAGDAAAAQVVTATVRADLERSGLFKLIDPAGSHARRKCIGQFQRLEKSRRRCAGRRQPGAQRRRPHGSALPAL